MTDGAGYLTTIDSDNLYLRARDLNTYNGYSGSIEYFYVEDSTSSATGTSSDPPVTIPDNGAYSYAQLTLTPPPQTINVPADYRKIQMALNAANSGDTIIVGDGTYTGERNRRLNFRGRAVLLRSANGPGNCILDCENLDMGVWFREGEGPNTVLDGFTIINGSHAHGGGIKVSDCNPTIKNCVITACSAATAGGGMHIMNHDPVIQNCIISGNTAVAKDGGGIRLWNSDAAITDCIIEDNTANRHGGGIMCYNGSSPTISGCLIDSNSAATFGGGIACKLNSDPAIENCTICDNSASEAGGLNIVSNSNPTGVNNIIRYNSQTSGRQIRVRLGTNSFTCTYSNFNP